MSIFTKIGAWFAKVWKNLKQNGAHTAVVITEEVQSLIKSGVLQAAAKIIEGILPITGKIPEELVQKLSDNIPKILAAELAIEGLPDNPTEKDIKDFSDRVVAAFVNLTDKSKLWTSFGAQVYGIIKAHVDSGEKYTFAQLVIDLEEAFQDYQNDLAQSQAENE